MSKVKVLIVDDSSIIRTLLNHIFSADPGLEVVGMAPDPYIAREKIVQLKPDVMTLDIEMPRMDGITFLSKIMKHLPVRTVVFSSLTAESSPLALQAMELGAVDVVAKPAVDVGEGINEITQMLVEKVKAAARANINPLTKLEIPKLKSVGSAALAQTTHQVMAIASSTGGTVALKELLPQLPPNLPGTLVVQHMPPVFSKTFAQALNKICPFEVVEAEGGERVQPGRVFIAPGDHHMEVERRGGYYYTVLHQQPPMHAVRPAADYLMRSVARHAGANAIGIVLTGMGKDGAAGLGAMKEAGSFNIAQDEATSVVFGMPAEAIEAGAVHEVHGLHQIPSVLMKQFRKRLVA